MHFEKETSVTLTQNIPRMQNQYNAVLLLQFKKLGEIDLLLR